VISAYKETVGDIQSLEELKKLTNEDPSQMFDVLEEHKYYCKWGRSKDIDEGKVLGWKVCVEILRFNILSGKGGVRRGGSRKIE
jgi:hypothetical protein